MKKTNENLVILITLFAISIVIANVTGARTITTGLHIGPIELALSGGAMNPFMVTGRPARALTLPENSRPNTPRAP